MGVLSLVSNEEIKRRLEGKRRGLSEIQRDEKTGKYKTCPHCKFKNPEKSIFCVKCGKKLETNVNVTCNTCGTINPKTAKFCIKCGNNLTTQESTKNKDEKEAESLVEDEKTEDENYIKNELTVESELEAENIQSDIKNQETVPEVDNKSIEVDDQEKSEINHFKTQGLPSSIPDKNLINQRDSKKTCKSCGAKNLKTAKFCVVCGEKFDIAPVEKSVEYPESPENNKEDLSSVEIDPMNKIKKAKELLDIGAITQEEFESIKSKYLDMV